MRDNFSWCEAYGRKGRLFQDDDKSRRYYKGKLVLCVITLILVENICLYLKVLKVNVY